MKRILSLVCVLSVFGLAGCNYEDAMKRTTTNVSPSGEVESIVEEEITNTMEYQKAVSEHNKNESERIKAQATAISQIDTTGLSPDARALLAISQINGITSLKPTPYSGKAPKTWIDVGDKVAGFTKEIVTGTVVYKGLDTIGEIAANAGDKTVTKVGNGSSASGFNTSKTKQEVTTTGQDDAVTQFQPAVSANPSTSASNDDPQTTQSHNTTEVVPDAR